jgi:probable F420-dependent oxidoreductase
MKIDGMLGPLDSARESARTVEAAGHDGAWVAEVNSDPFLPLTLAAEATTELELGTSIAVAFARSPMALAYTANDLQRFSRGRLLLGLGSQVKAHVTRRFSMPWGRPAAQMREYILALRAIWAAWSDGTRLAFEGEYYSHTLMTPMFTPVPHAFGPPKIVLAGVGDLMTRAAGEVADGFLCHAFTTPRWIREHTLPALAAGRARSGQDLTGYDVVAVPFVATGTDEQIAGAVPAIRAQVAFYASTPSYRPVLELHGWGDLGAELTVLSKQNRWAEMATMIDDEVLDAFAIVAPPGEIVARVAERYGGLATRLIVPGLAALPPEQAAEAFAALRQIPTPSPSVLA